MRTTDQINRQIDGLRAEKQRLPAVSGLGTPNHEIADAKISILQGNEELKDFDEGDWEEMDETYQIYLGAEEAQQWMDEEREEDLFEEEE